MAVETRSFLLALLLVPGVAAQEDRAPTRTLVAAPLGPNETIDLDGRLDEAAWARAIPAEGFRQVDPDNGAPVTERTEVRILIDADRLILGIMAYDSDPDAVRGNVMQRNAPFLGDDSFAWTLDTYQDGRTGYYFVINPAGGMADGLGGAGAGGEVDGAAVAGAAAGALLAPEAAAPTRPGMAFGTPAWPCTSGGCSAEVELPLRTLNFDPDLNAWSINFERTIGRKNEEVRWNGYARNQTVSAMAAAGLVTGLDEVRQEFGLDVKPYFAGARPLSPPSAPPPPTPAISARTSSTTSPLICARTSPSTPNFAETEVDDRQVNLTRFPLRFPEKREFFLQGINEYNFSGDGNAFFSRRIGLNDGAVQPVDVGSKLNGQLGAFEVAALHVRNAALDRSVAEDGTGGPLPGEDFIVLRSRRLFFSQSHLGVLYTRRSERGTDADPLHMMGVDLRLATANLLGRGLNFRNRTYYTVADGLAGRAQRPLRLGVRLSQRPLEPPRRFQPDSDPRTLPSSDSCSGPTSASTRVTRSGTRGRPRSRRSGSSASGSPPPSSPISLTGG